ncbi:hypothetical protein [Serratia sp. OS31]|uniref:hypothetical protein n=1 Tax=Serratia sp. OS31 TaxID=2760844 RepID=UPI0016016EA8|nr:hypothetical protein [Serratia sp. OS31]MBB1584182.1 hypothetical protein [Serratia sp. OS31]
MERPDPHPLDYDWRFTNETADYIASLCNKDPTLAIGVPTVASKLDDENRNVTLVDWHPIQIAKHHLHIDVNNSPAFIGDFANVVMDPPWYLDVYYRWLSWAANSAGRHAIIILSIWPDSTRPLAKKEKDELYSWINTWGDITTHENILSYEIPEFEKNTYKKSIPSPSRFGDLVLIKIKSTPTLLEYKSMGDKWHRYILNNYQIAIKDTIHKHELYKIKKIDHANGWIWPSVSQRALGRENIELWSSENEVAAIGNPTKLIDCFDELIATGNTRYLTDEFPELSSWDIPKPPYKRMKKWIQNC